MLPFTLTFSPLLRRDADPYPRDEAFEQLSAFALKLGYTVTPPLPSGVALPSRTLHALVILERIASHTELLSPVLLWRLCDPAPASHAMVKDACGATYTPPGLWRELLGCKWQSQPNVIFERLTSNGLLEIVGRGLPPLLPMQRHKRGATALLHKLTPQGLAMAQEAAPMVPASFMDAADEYAASLLDPDAPRSEEQSVVPLSESVKVRPRRGGRTLRGVTVKGW